MPAVGLEPTRGCPQQILSLPRLPFRHAGICSTEQMIYYHIFIKIASIFYNHFDDSKKLRVNNFVAPVI